MVTILWLVFVISVVCLVIGIKNPGRFNEAFKGKANRKNIALSFGGVAIVSFIAAVALAGSGSTVGTSTTTPSTSQTATSSPSAPAPSPTPTPPPVRQVVGTAVTLGTGTFTGGKDVAVGLYDVTTVSGQSGNFFVSGNDDVNEILGVSSGQGVLKVRTRISSGDSIEIKSLRQVHFEPVTTAFVTTAQNVSLYAGTWTAGEDVAPGRYVATATAGSGNFFVSGRNSVNEILGGSYGVPTITFNLAKGDTIDIRSLNQVSLTLAN